MPRRRIWMAACALAALAATPACRKEIDRTSAPAKPAAATKAQTKAHAAPASTAPAAPAKAEAQAAPAAAAHGHAEGPKKPNHDAESILAKIMRDNGEFRQNKDAKYFDHFAEKQQPRATLVACADSRFHEHALDSSPDDDLFVIRNIGNQVDSTPGSVKYGVRHLHTPLLIIVGHVRCGAIKAVMNDYGDEHASIRRELDGLHLSIYRTKATGTPSEKWTQYVVGNVHQQVHDALSEYKDEVKAGKLTVVGAVYDFMNELGEGRGKIVFVNINGEMDRAKVAAHPVFVKARQKAGL